MWKLGIVRCNMSIYLVSLFCKCRMILVNRRLDSTELRTGIEPVTSEVVTHACMQSNQIHNLCLRRCSSSSSMINNCSFYSSMINDSTWYDLFSFVDRS